jgi:hypothetical protein
MTRRNKTLFTLGFVLFFAGWLAWKFIVTKAFLTAPPPPAERGAAE